MYLYPPPPQKGGTNTLGGQFSENSVPLWKIQLLGFFHFSTEQSTLKKSSIPPVGGQMVSGTALEKQIKDFLNCVVIEQSQITKTFAFPLQTSDEFKLNTETRLRTAEKDVKEYKSQLANLQALNQDLNATRAKVTREAEAQTKSLRDMLSKVRAELDEALKKAQTSSAAEMTAKEELKEQAILAKEVIVISVSVQSTRKSFLLSRDIL